MKIIEELRREKFADKVLPLKTTNINLLLNENISAKAKFS